MVCKNFSPYVTGSEKRGYITQNANFYHFSNCHHAKAFRALGLLTLQTLQAFYFTDPTLKATACLLSRAVSCQSKVYNGRFRTSGSMRARHAPTGSGRGSGILASFKSVATQLQSYKRFKTKIRDLREVSLFWDPVTFGIRLCCHGYLLILL